MKKPKVSVIMAVFNGEKYLRDSINSILGQSFTDFEFIIVSDGSTDKSEDIVNSYHDKRIRFFKNAKNFGLPYSLNLAIRLSKGEYLVRMDQDDISFPKRIATQVGFMNAHPKVDICGAAVETTIDNHKTISRRPADSEEIKATLLFHNVLSHSSVIIRRRSLVKEKLFYDPAVKNAEDYEFWTRCCWLLKMTNLSTPLLFYRRHRNQMVSQSTLKPAVAASRNNMLKHFINHPTVRELALHSRIANGQTEISWAEIDSTEDWLKKILVSNREKSLIKNLAMASVVEEQWFNVCARSTRLGAKLFHRYLISPITSHAPRKWSHVAILMVKAVMSKFSA